MKIKKIVAGIFCATAGACLLANLGLTMYQMQASEFREEKIIDYFDMEIARQTEENKKENTYLEDGYVVGESYEIRSTTVISDAYLSGDEHLLNAEEKETLKIASEILEEQTKECKNNYERELKIYEWMFANIGQDGSNSVALPTEIANDYTPYGVLKGRQAVCVGYATTFRLFMNMLGMECHIVHNDYHSWDLVQLDDGEWYHVDVYNDVSDGCMHNCFNMSDGNAKLTSHEWDGSALPEAKGTTYTYPAQNVEELDDIYQIPKNVAKALKKKKDGLFYHFRAPVSDETINEVNMMVENMYGVIQEVSDYKTTMASSWWEDGEDGYILAIYLNRSIDVQDNNQNKVDKKKQKQIKKAIEKAFDVEIELNAYEDENEY